MSRPRGFADLAGLRVGIFGVGVEGRAAARRISTVAAAVILVDDAPAGDDGVLATNEGGLEALATCDVILKSPGVPRRRRELTELEAAGVVVTSALSLWFDEVERTHVIAITGTKGKSTTTTIVAFLLGALGHSAAVAGNIGRPPYEADFPTTEWVVVEVSSFQAADVHTAPAFVVVTSLGADHLDWHGDVAKYHEDKLRLTHGEGDHVSFIAEDPVLEANRSQIGGDVRVVRAEDLGLAAALGLLGRHNVSNVALALAVVSAATSTNVADVASAGLAASDNFEPLPGRMTLIGERDGVWFIDDGLATAPLPTIAALEVVGDVALALIVGGFDRGVDYTGLAEAIAHRHAPTTLVAMPEAGERIARTVLERTRIDVRHVATMHEAVDVATRAVTHGGVVLLSPGAPSFGAYANWRERSDDFARCVREAR